MHLSIPTDKNGYLLLKCSSCGELFKLTPSDIRDKTILLIHCPACVYAAYDFTSFLSDDVIDYVNDIAHDLVSDAIDKTFNNLENKTKNSSIKFKTIKKEVKRNPKPLYSSIEALEPFYYKCCRKTAFISSLLKQSGSNCPFCGVHNYGIQ